MSRKKESAAKSEKDVDDAEQEHIYVTDLAKRLFRTAHTIRQWIIRDDFRAFSEAYPIDLMPSKEGGRGKIFWVEEQVAGIEAFAQSISSERGWAGYHKRRREAEEAARTSAS